MTAPAVDSPTPASPVPEALGRMATAAPLELTVRGDCMRPLLADGQRIEVRGAARYWPGDVIAFPTADGRLAVHRVIGYRLRGGLRLQTRADASGTLDPPLPPRRVLGRVAGLAVPARDRARALWRFARLALLGHLPR